MEYLEEEVDMDEDDIEDYEGFEDDGDHDDDDDDDDDGGTFEDENGDDQPSSSGSGLFWTTQGDWQKLQASADVEKEMALP